MVTEDDLTLSDGRTLHVYDAAAHDTCGRLVVVWHHGTPNTGAPPEPLLAAADQRGIRWVSYDRPGYGGSTPLEGRDVASAAADVAAIADALGVGSFAVMGHSGGGPHALACSTLLPDRVVAAVSIAGLAPLNAKGIDWFGGMAGSGVAELHAAIEGRLALEECLASGEYDPRMFTASDHAALAGDWSWLLSVVALAQAGGRDGMVADDLAYVRPWGFAPASTVAPVLILQGGQDRIVPRAHGAWFARHLRSSTLWLRPMDGHISVLSSAVAAMDWLTEHAHD
ncbi:MAG TPA: alpha/beta hydrolase [Cellulomonadaceae bacterium]|nr:alpha/beta hydrolase [Cellulomonadaceae bacterium]